MNHKAVMIRSQPFPLGLDSRFHGNDKRFLGMTKDFEE
jgi:hypothetical protein